MSKHIRSIGIEIEGAWDGDARPDTRIKRDGSVIFRSLDYNYRIGEVASLPLPDIDAVNNFVSVNYPTKVNRTCGIHVHTSFKHSQHYARLMDYGFYAYFLERMEAWGTANLKPTHRFWRRFRGGNGYCERLHRPESQVDTRRRLSGTRYTHLNYCHGLHGTIENRMLPSFKSPATAQSAIMEYIDIVESYLMRPRVEVDLTVNEDVDIDEVMPMYREEPAICVS